MGLGEYGSTKVRLLGVANGSLKGLYWGSFKGSTRVPLRALLRFL